MSNQNQGKQAPSPETTHWRKVHRRQNVNLLFAEELGGLKAVDVEIVESGVLQVKTSNAKTKPMPYLAFRGKAKKLGLNATNCKAMQAITGTGIIEQWRGWITLTVVQTKYKDQLTGRDEVTDAIRIAPKRPKGKEGAEDARRAEPDGETLTLRARLLDELTRMQVEIDPAALSDMTDEDLQAEIELSKRGGVVDEGQAGG